MAGTGSLIQIHYHANFDVLEELSEVNGNLYYKNLPIFVQVSEEKNNAITKKKDGIHVDSSFFLNETQYQVLSKFEFYNGNLVYDGRIVSWEYTEDQLYVLHKQIWNELNEEYTNTNAALPDNAFVTSDKNVFLTQDNNVFIGGE